MGLPSVGLIDYVRVDYERSLEEQVESKVTYYRRRSNSGHARRKPPASSLFARNTYPNSSKDLLKVQQDNCVRYTITVTSSNHRSWFVLRRYSEFRTFRDKLIAIMGKEPTRQCGLLTLGDWRTRFKIFGFPPKRWNNHGQTVIAERCNYLTEWLNNIVLAFGYLFMLSNLQPDDILSNLRSVMDDFLGAPSLQKSFKTFSTSHEISSGYGVLKRKQSAEEIVKPEEHWEKLEDNFGTIIRL